MLPAATEEKPSLAIERDFAAPAALVYRLWTDAELLKRWFGPKGFACPSFTMDFRIGGSYRGVIRSHVHGEYGFAGTICEIVPARRIVMRFAWDEPGSTETTITIDFSEQNGITTQRFRQEPFVSAAERDSHLGGWQECLDRQRAYLDAHQENRP